MIELFFITEKYDWKICNHLQPINVYQMSLTLTWHSMIKFWLHLNTDETNALEGIKSNQFG